MTTQAGYDREHFVVHVDAIPELTKKMYYIFIECNVPIRSSHMATQQIIHVHLFIKSSIK